jgi:DNA-binding CsgD family transcriptional regulator
LHELEQGAARHSHVELRRPGRIDDCVYSLHRLPVKSWVAGLGVHRDWGDRAQFTRRDREVLDLLNTHLSWMWTSDANHNLPQADGLSPRLRQTLRLLLTGRSEKEIAGAMGLNRGTVHKYVTALYRHFDVGSRAQLLARCLGSSAASQAERPKAG